MTFLLYPFLVKKCISLIRLVEVFQCLIVKQQCSDIPRNQLKYVLQSQLRFSFCWICLAQDQPINLPKWQCGLFEILFVTFRTPVVSIREQRARRFDYCESVSVYVCVRRVLLHCINREFKVWSLSYGLVI